MLVIISITTLNDFCFVQLLKDEYSKAKPGSEVLKELMVRIFPYRRGWILDTAATQSATDIIDETPLLKKTIYYVSYPLEYTLLTHLCCMNVFHFRASQEFGLIMERQDVRERFDEDYMKWARAIIKYSKETQVKNSAIQLMVSVYSEDCSAGR